MPEGQLVDFPSVSLITKSTSCSHTDLGPTIGRLYGEIGQANPNLEMAGAPRIYYTEWQPEQCTIQASIPVDESVMAGGDTVKVSYPEGTAFMTTHMGSYEGLAAAWEDLWAQISNLGLKATGLCWDDYVTDPGQEPDQSKWQTDIYVAVEIAKI